MEQKRIQHKSTFILIFFIFLLMIMNAVAENIRGVLVPVFKLEFGVKDTNIGVFLFIGSLGYVIATFIGGLLCEKIGQKKVLLTGMIFMIISLIMFMKVDVFIGLLIGIFIMNLGLALTSIAINTLIPVLLLSFQALLMNVTHFCYGIGASIGPKVAGNLISKGVNWRNIYMYILFMFIILLIIFSFLKVPDVHKSSENKDKGEVDKTLVVLYIIALGFYVCAELGTGSWLINYIKNVYAYNEATSATYLSIFFGMLTIGRLLGGAVVEKFGYINTIVKSLIIAFILYTIALLMGEKGLILISISGLFFSITFPTTVVSMSKVFTKDVSFITGIVLTSASAINMVMNVVIGRLNDTIGCKIAFYLIPISLFICIIFMSIINVKIRGISEGGSEK